MRAICSAVRVLSSLPLFIASLVAVALTPGRAEAQCDALQGPQVDTLQTPSADGPERVVTMGAGGGTLCVRVSPDDSSITRLANTNGLSESFWVVNESPDDDSYSLSCFANPPYVTCTGLSQSTLFLSAGDSALITAFYNTGSVGTGALQLSVVGSVSGSDVGSYVVAILAKGPPILAFRNQNGDNRDRSLCLTAGAGEAAAWQCGDLLVAHGLPGYATMGRERSLTLLYNSAQAVPRPVVAAAVNQTNNFQPDTVIVLLYFGATLRDSAKYAGWSGSTRQIVLPHDGTADSSGLYAFRLVVRNKYNGLPLKEDSLKDTLIVVNRSQSRYGAGWSLAGVEELRLNQAGNKILWVGGDGSAKVYRNVATNTWLAAAGAFRDTLIKFDSASVSWYRRTLRHRVQVTYDATGRHRFTTNRVGHTTTFTWSTSGDTLKSITVPPGITGTTYTLAYAGGKLDKITDPAGRVLDATVASNRLTQLIDPDTAVWHTDFSYDAAGRMLGRTNRRGFTTRYAYGNNLRVTRDSIRVDSVAATYAVTTFRPWDEQGVAPANGATGVQAVDTALVYTKIDGPRDSLVVGDTAEFWVDRWGAPVKVRDPLGSVTTLQRSSANAPALVTRIATPDGRVVGSGYNTRGNVTYVADSTYEGTGTTQTVTTNYVYGQSQVPDSPTEVRSLFDTTRFHYDTLWGLLDTITAQGGHKTSFEYLWPYGRLSYIREWSVSVVDTVAWTKSTATLATAFSYDGFGNDSVVTTPKGAVTRYGHDAFRRVNRVTDPMNHVTLAAYDAMNRATSMTTVAPESLATRYFYSRNGMIDSVWDARKVRRQWRYDPVEQPTRLTDELGDTARQYFGISGLVDSSRIRSGHVIKNRYDAAGRLTATTYPSFRNYFNVPGFDSSLSYTVPGDSIRSTYDAVGRLLQAVQAKDTVTFTYNREGTVRTERQVVRASDGTLLSDRTLRYWYDVGGRRTKVFNGTDTLRYTYGTNGRLATVVVQWTTTGIQPDTFRFYWDGLGRRDSVVYVKLQAFVSFGYDRDGNLRMVCSRHIAGSGNSHYMTQRVRYTSLNADGVPLAFRRYVGGGDTPTSTCADTPGLGIEVPNYQYDARHQMINDGSNSYAYDSSGNRLSTRAGGVLQDSLLYVSGSNRVWKRFGYLGSLDFTANIDSNGWRHSDWPSAPDGYRLYYYNSLGQMTGQKSMVNGVDWIGGSTACHYDPLGRRVSTCNVGVNTPNGTSALDGQNVVRIVGGVDWRFAHGPGLDDPLVAVYHTTGYTKYYYLTDGRGRLLAFTDSLGNDAISFSEHPYTEKGGNQTGAIERSNTFANSRAESPGAPQLSYYRNRYYDQRTGQWTQEDPIGIAGGANLYQYAGNNPVTFTDPFGLKVDVEYTDDKTKAEVDSMRKKSKTFDNAVRRLEGDHSVLVRIGRGDTSDCGGPGGCTQYVGKNKDGQEEVDITLHDGAIAADNNLQRNVGGADALTTIAHEFYGHAEYYLTQGKACPDAYPGTPANRVCSVRRENVIRREMGYPPRTQY